MEKGEGMKSALFLKVPNYTNTILICVSTLCGGTGGRREGGVPPFIKCCAETHTSVNISPVTEISTA